MRPRRTRPGAVGPARRRAVRLGASLVLLGGPAALTVLTACAGDGAPPARPPASAPPTTSTALAAARTAFEQTRDAALGAVARVTTAASALDEADASARSGTLSAAARQVPAATAAAGAAAPAVAGLDRQVTAYAAAVAQLQQAVGTPGLTTAQQQALRGLALAAGTETGALRTLVRSQAAGWPAYTGLQLAQALWLTRAQDGDYADEQTLAYSPRVAGDAYTVLVNPQQAALARERTSLATGTDTLQSARTATTTALDAVRAALG